MADQEWYTVAEAAEYLRVSRRTIYKLVQDGRLMAHRLGEIRHVRFRREALDQVLRPIMPGETGSPDDSERAA